MNKAYHGCTQESFLKRVSEHQMTVLRDDGVCRHVRFSVPGTSIAQFDLVTWPWHLCYTGDMGTYVFVRLNDMFEFFRQSPRANGDLFINPGYWAEKCAAACRDGVTEYSAEKFRSVIAEQVEEWSAEHEWSEVPDGLREAIDDVLRNADEGEYAAREAVRRFSYDDEVYGKFEFSDFWETSLSEYTFRFIWCCYALAWGIRAYDAAKPTPPLLQQEVAA